MMPILFLLLSAFIVTVIGAVLADKRNVRVHPLIQHGAEPYQTALRDQVDDLLYWIRLPNNTYDLCSEQAVLATIYFHKHGGLQGGTSAEGRWTIDDHGLIRKDGAESQELARFKGDIWHGRHTLTFSDGTRAVWEGTLIYGGSTAFRQPDGKLLVRFNWTGRSVKIEQIARALPQLSLLVLVGGGMMMQTMDFSDWGG